MGTWHKRGRSLPCAVVGSVAVEGEIGQSTQRLTVVKQCVCFGTTALFIVCIQRGRHIEVPFALLGKILQVQFLPYRRVPFSLFIVEEVLSIVSIIFWTES